MEDYITEMLVGQKGAVRGVGKIVVMPSTIILNSEIKVDSSLQAYLIAGGFYFQNHIVLKENQKNQEMWEGEIILLPKRKYSGKGGCMHGWTINQMLTDNYGDPGKWGRKYFEI